MATGSITSALDALTTKKGAAIAGVAILGLAGLFQIGRHDTAAMPGQAPRVQLAEARLVADPTGSFTPQQVSALQGIIKDYLISNPDVMVEITKEIEKRQQVLQAAEHQKLIADNKASIFSRPGDFVYGNAKGDVTVVEFFDYNCGWCKKAIDDVVKLTKADPKVRVVMKEFPIFGEASSLAAKAAMASVKQGKYWEFHTALMREKQVTKENLFPIAEKVGLNVAKLMTDMADPKLEEALKETTQIAQALGIEGTPGFIVDSKINVGYLPAEGLQQMIGEIRKAGCQMC